MKFFVVVCLALVHCAVFANLDLTGKWSFSTSACKKKGDFILFPFDTVFEQWRMEFKPDGTLIESVHLNPSESSSCVREFQGTYHWSNQNHLKKNNSLMVEVVSENTRGHCLGGAFFESVPNRQTVSDVQMHRNKKILYWKMDQSPPRCFHWYMVFVKEK